ncbi:MAG: lipoate--protein ligase family protein [Coriobacteriia bacterium]
MAAETARSVLTRVQDWRLIIDGPVEGAWNMAIDRAVLRARSTGDAPPTLRLYRWTVPTVTLGRFQPAGDVDRDLCRRSGFAVVRRPTGGRGVLHNDELTYSIVASTEDGVPQGVAASYRHLCSALAAAYATLGVPAELTARPRGERGAGACYLHSTHADLSLGAAKLSGSAQVWERGAVLQHGSFVRSRDTAAEARVFRLGEEATARLERETTTLADVLGAAPSLDRIAQTVIGAVEETLGIRLVSGNLSREEQEEAHSTVGAFRIEE